MKSFYIFLIVFYLVIFDSLAQSKVMTATRIDKSPKIDGILNDECWVKGKAFFEGKFIQTEPDNGKEASHKTKVTIAYDDYAIYVAAKLYDDDPKSIPRELGVRDTYNNADVFAVSFDTYNNGLNAFSFAVTSAGVQVDTYEMSNRGDRNWNAVWESAVQFDEEGWNVEFKIPYSAIRFAKKDIQTWGVNINRTSKRENEDTFWSHVDPMVNGYITQFGQLKGITNVKPPLRLQLSPYLSYYYSVDEVNNTRSSYPTGGMDLKLGLNESYTLDMTLIPDFGQVQSDNVVLNLSPFEVRYAENRPFFTENMDLFNKGGLVYSRRVGEHYGITGEYDSDTEEVISEPTSAPLINATKVSGRSQKGLGLGLINAVTGPTYAKVKNKEDDSTETMRDVLASPYQNYNVVVVDQALKNNSNVAVINTNVWRDQNARQANVTGVQANLFDKSNTYKVDLFTSMSALKNQGESEFFTGHKFNLILSKVSGKWRYGLWQKLETDTYEENDLGFNPQNNQFRTGAWGSINFFEPTKTFIRFSQEVGFKYERLYKPSVFSNYFLYTRTRAKFQNFWNYGFNADWRPSDSYDYFEPRHDGHYFIKPASYNLHHWVSTDNRKRFRASGFIGFWHRPSWDQFDNWCGGNMTFRVNNMLSLRVGSRVQYVRDELGYVNETLDEQDELQNIIFGSRDVMTNVNSLSLKCTFNNMMGLQMRLRHYWSEVSYADQYYNLQEDGTVVENPEYSGVDEEGVSLHDKNFNAFNFETFYTWQVAPGSFLTIVYKDAINTDDPSIGYSFTENMDYTLKSAHQHNISVRFLYFLDFLDIKKVMSEI